MILKMQKMQNPKKSVKKRLIAQHEFVLTTSMIERPTGASMTVPDESMSIRDILRKHVSGIRVADSLQRSGVYYDGDFDSPDVEKLRDDDLTVQEDYTRFIDSRAKAAKKSIEDRKKASSAPSASAEEKPAPAQPKTVPEKEPKTDPE